MERREYTRLTVDLDSTLRWPDGRMASGRIRDISFGGAYLELAAPPLAAAAALPVRGCTLMLRLPASEVTVQGDVVDLAGPRLGLRFTGAEEAEFARLRDYLLASAPDPDALRREVEQSPNPAFSPPLKLPSFQHWIERMRARLGGRDQGR